MAAQHGSPALDLRSAPVLAQGAFHGVAAFAGAPLDAANQLVLLAFDVAKVVIRELGPLLLEFALGEIPVSLELEVVHNAFCCGYVVYSLCGAPKRRGLLRCKTSAKTCRAVDSLGNRPPTGRLMKISLLAFAECTGNSCSPQPADLGGAALLRYGSSMGIDFIPPRFPPCNVHGSLAPVCKLHGERGEMEAKSAGFPREFIGNLAARCQLNEW